MDIPDFSFLPINSTTALTIGVPALFFLCLLYLQAAKDKTSPLYLVCKVIVQFIWYDIICNIVPGLKKYNKEFHSQDSTEESTVILPLDLSSDEIIQKQFQNKQLLRDSVQPFYLNDEELIKNINALSPEILDVKLIRDYDIQKTIVKIQVSQVYNKQIILDLDRSDLFYNDHITSVKVLHQ